MWENNFADILKKFPKYRSENNFIVINQNYVGISSNAAKNFDIL